jgi:hypothetical protein
MVKKIKNPQPTKKRIVRKMRGPGPGKPSDSKARD